MLLIAAAAFVGVSLVVSVVALVLEPILTGGDIDSIFATGMHEFLTQFISDNNKLGEAIAEQYLF